MKRYLLFTGDDYYPRGGWDDFQGAYDSVDEAARIGNESIDDWWTVIDTETVQEVKAGHRSLAERFGKLKGKSP